MKKNTWYKLTLKLFKKMCLMPSAKSYSIVIYDARMKDVFHANYYAIDKDKKGIDRLTFLGENDWKYFMPLYSSVMSLEEDWKDGLMTYKELEKEMKEKKDAYISIVMEEDPA